MEEEKNSVPENEKESLVSGRKPHATGPRARKGRLVERISDIMGRTRKLRHEFLSKIPTINRSTALQHRAGGGCCGRGSALGAQ